MFNRNAGVYPQVYMASQSRGTSMTKLLYLLLSNPVTLLLTINGQLESSIPSFILRHILITLKFILRPNSFVEQVRYHRF